MRTPTTTANSPNSPNPPTSPATRGTTEPTSTTTNGTTTGTSTPAPTSLRDKPASTKPGVPHGGDPRRRPGRGADRGRHPDDQEGGEVRRGRAPALRVDQ